MSSDLARIAGSTARGHQYHRDERFERAAACFCEAIALVDTLPQGNAECRLLRAELVAAHAAVLIDLGRWADAEEPLREALQTLSEGAEAATDTGRILMALLSFELARCLVVRRELPAGQDLLRAALNHLQGLDADLLRGRVIGGLGSALGMANDPERGLPLLEESLAVLRRPLLRPFARERALVISNVAAFNVMLGRRDAAADHFAEAEAVLQGLVDAGRRSARVELARTRMNLGVTCELSERLGDAERALRAARSDYDLAIRQLPRGADDFRIQASRAGVLMNLGYCLFRQERFGEARRCLQAASRSYAKLVGAHPQLRQDQAKTWINEAHLAARAGRHKGAAGLYAKGLATLTRMQKEGHAHVVPDHVNAALGLARVELAAGRVEPACALFEQAMGALVAMSQRGQLRHAETWLAAWQAQMTATLAARAVRRGAGRAAALAALARVLEQPPRRALMGGDDAARALLAGVGLVEGWLAAAPQDLALVDLVHHYLSHLLDWLADVLSESEPAWLQRHAATLQQVVGRLRDAGSALPEASQWLADWFFHTRGLRAQRSALAQGHEPRLVALRELLAELRQLEDEMLGAAGTSVAPRTGGGRTANVAVLAPGAVPAQADRQAAAWRDLHARVTALRDAAVADGLLPSALRVKVRSLAGRMASNAALLLLARCDDGRLLVIVVQGGDAVQVRHAFVAPHADMAAFSPLELNLLARRALAQRTGGRALRAASAADGEASKGADVPAVADADRFALALYGTVWTQTVAPQLRALAAIGVDDLCLLPSDELHVLPWSHFAAQEPAWDVRLAVYPSAGAWLRCRVGAAAAEAAARAAPNWAVASSAALDTTQPLPWVEIERWLSQRLWQGVSARFEPLSAQPRIDGVDALLGMGHGAAPDDNPAHVGLALDGGAVLSAHDLLHVRTCRRALLSACVLGRTDEVFGEPLGFLSTCFDYQTNFGCGWLTEVPDAEACLFSLALQHALRSSNSIHWGQVFKQTRQAIGRGAWPSQFGPWLAQQLPAALAESAAAASHLAAAGIDRGVYAAPPASLQRLMPWAVALGY